MRRVNVDRMRKVNMATIDALYPVRWITGLPVDETQVWDSSSLGMLWALPDGDVTFERRPKRVKRWAMRAVEDR